MKFLFLSKNIQSPAELCVLDLTNIRLTLRLGSDFEKDQQYLIVWGQCISDVLLTVSPRLLPGATLGALYTLAGRMFIVNI